MTTGGLRRDLIAVADRWQPRRVKLIDAVAGRVTRLARQDLDRLSGRVGVRASGRGGDRSPGQPHADPAATLWDEAGQQGLLRRRPPPAMYRGLSGWLSWPQRQLLCLRLPLFAGDPLARRLASHSGWLFARPAVLFWMVAMLLAAGSMLSGWDRAAGAMNSLRHWQQSPVGWLTIAAILGLTKLAHELAHAVACRRAGVACGEFGVLLFAGMPCPYCDVSLVSRLDNSIPRIGVMLAGVYIEAILATVATAIWWVVPLGSTGGLAGESLNPLSAICLSVMIVCGVSTLLFNLNPLLRLDGYYVLSDLLGATHLRSQAATAWHLAARGRLPIGWRNLLLTVYHPAAALFRLMVLASIGWMLLAVSTAMQLRPLGVLAVIVLMLPLAAATLSVGWAIVAGDGRWRPVPWWRRLAWLAVGGGGLVAVLAIPLPRQIVVTGYLDARDPQPIHAVQDGWVTAAALPYGATVTAGQWLWQQENQQLDLEIARWDSRRRLAQLQSAALRRNVLIDDSVDGAWQLDAANRRLVDSQWQALQLRQQQMRLHAGASGQLLPPSIDPSPLARQTASLAAAADSLSPAPPTAATGWVQRHAVVGQLLGRIADPRQLTAHLIIPASDRRLVKPGQTVRLIGDLGGDDAAPWVAETTVAQISEIATGAGSGRSLPQLHQPQQPTGAISAATDRFEVRCSVPAESLDAIVLSAGGACPLAPLGAVVEGRIRVGRETIGQRMYRWIQESFHE